MSNEIMEPQTVKYAVNGQEVKLSPNAIRKYLVRGNKEVTDQEVMMFLSLCKYQQLNPFLNEAYLVKFNQDAQIIVGKEAFMKRAENHPKYGGFKAGILVERNGEIVEIEGSVKLDNDKLIGGWAEVYRNDRKVPVKARIAFSEFNKGQSTWKVMPMLMIRKTAIVNALREAFPDTLGAMYTEEETVGNVSEVQTEIKQNANQQLIDIPKQEDVQDLSTKKSAEPEVVEAQIKEEKQEPAPVIDVEDDLFAD